MRTVSSPEAPLHQDVCTKAAAVGKRVQMRSRQQGHRYVSWCVDAAGAPTPEAAAEESSHRNQPAASASLPLLLLSPPQSSGGEPEHTVPPQAFTEGTRHEACTHQSQSGSQSVSQSVSQSGSQSGSQSSLLHPEDKTCLLPRSSPVISRRHRPVSWHGGVSSTAASEPSSSLDSRSVDQRGGLGVTSLEDLGPKRSSCLQPSPLQEDTQPGFVSALSHVNHLLGAGLQIPFSGLQGLRDDSRGPGQAGGGAPRPPGFSTSTQNSKDRSCSRLTELSADIFKTTCDLEKENAHFIVVDMMLEVLEGVKWTLSFDGHTHSAQDTPETDRTPQQSTHSCDVHTHRHTQEEEEEEAGNPEHPPKTFSVLSTDSGFEDCGADTLQTPADSLRSAERLAQQLVQDFRRSWLPCAGPRRGRLSLRSSLRELPGTGDVAESSSSLEEEIRLRTRMRGSLSWAPPRFQIIFTVQPTLRRGEVVALQHFLCAGCGTQVEPRYIKKLRYCDYLGRYFCDCCHSGSEAVIPGRLLSCWDFGRYPVSDFSKQLLDSVWQQPLFDLSIVGKTLCGKVKELDKFRELLDQLMGIKKLLTTCRLSGRVMAEFEQFPAHLLEPPQLFSMENLFRVKKGRLVAQARALLQSAVDHVENCELCLARGFICEFCRERDIIFPFQRDTCRRCPVCRACFHKHCFAEKRCPKCARIQSRKKRPDGSMK